MPTLSQVVRFLLAKLAYGGRGGQGSKDRGQTGEVGGAARRLQLFLVVAIAELAA